MKGDLISFAMGQMDSSFLSEYRYAEGRNSLVLRKSRGLSSYGWATRKRVEEDFRCKDYGQFVVNAYSELLESG